MKKFFAITALSIAFLGASAFKNMNGNGKVLMTVSFEVKDYNEWKKLFDAGAPVREKAGIKVLSVCCLASNANQVMVIEEAESMQKAKDFLEIVKSKQKAGDLSKMEVKLYNEQE